MFSKTCEYGIRSCIYICCQTIKGKRPNLQDVARMIESPEAFTAKIIRQLGKKGDSPVIQRSRRRIQCRSGKNEIYNTVSDYRSF
jgi:hypothetical protein